MQSVVWRFSAVLSSDDWCEGCQEFNGSPLQCTALHHVLMHLLWWVGGGEVTELITNLIKTFLTPPLALCSRTQRL